MNVIRGWGRTKFLAGPMSGTSGQGSRPLCKSASSSEVLSALDTFLTTDEDGVIDLTIPENDALSGLVGAQLMASSSS
jgi:hypothetical protein